MEYRKEKRPLKGGRFDSGKNTRYFYVEYAALLLPDRGKTLRASIH